MGALTQSGCSPAPLRAADAELLTFRTVLLLRPAVPRRGGAPGLSSDRPRPRPRRRRRSRRQPAGGSDVGAAAETAAAPSGLPPRSLTAPAAAAAAGVTL